MKNILSILILTSLLFTSCKKEEVAEEATIAEDATTVATTDSLVTPTEVQQQVQPVATGSNPTSVMNGQPIVGSTTTPPPPQNVAKGMNPAHGQPGHRCDISVGEPLNSPPGKKSTSNIPPTITQAKTVTPEMLKQANRPSQTSSTPAVVTPAAEPVVTAPGMNPPHGQEGHVCGTAVGAPLPK